MPLSDSSGTCMRAVWPEPSPAVLRLGFAAGVSEVSRFSCMKFLGVLWGLRLRRTDQRLAISPLLMLPSAHLNCVGVLIASFRSSIPSPPIPLFTLRCAPRDAQRKTRGRVDRYSFLVGILPPLLHAGLSRRTGTANSTKIGPLVGKRLKHFFADDFLAIVAQFRVSPLRMKIERMKHGADGFVMRKVHRASTTFSLPLGPGAVQSVLQDGELIGIVSNVIDQPGQQLRTDFSARNRDWTCDCRPSLVSRHARDQVLPTVDRFGQPEKLGAVSQKVRPHGQNDVDRKVGADRLKQKVDEGNRSLEGPVWPRLSRLQILKAEQLLELIDDHLPRLLLDYSQEVFLKHALHTGLYRFVFRRDEIVILSVVGKVYTT